ncbi:NAD(P)H-binding protein [Alloalcanivorax xenomutans]|mgnify:CR=1 FL=1|jgi:uncharacterized protein YbjT (DUF2867 family)|uniref:NAD(P)H-binding protein n=1 Tax=Alloalcanivorax xenomutans TaxID=1094342 RepID=A0A9Q3W0Z4_9GAMM|nr:NAD(P)H-binding protein [Alloalcanivorax xenomutans]ERS14774.1 hypothetical protein Q668_08695 [Alcanivorax sp. PN-3]KYZ87292.1 hypothetical protein A3Q32_13065 [Alcanivorax sp. KX64203]MBA4722167.1 NAD(P)H-binding protein [Alcanivorax sp.]ARB46012.1 hypothetical protein P40_11835 [Alloalcanivorax xenomutans]MCE7508655.1 NAD(P)H-binding protein [Alloalcanivorax xenomutans]|eukprot:gnl/TRDRNA2_/TRDRNA2_174223_c0_seq1.p1 gnl/TRDRNA2_/TRDRNA2_174223_c0~~gnl/TRDRNA2_/TRDRNA2_174223_c0_seq1.p1  ORF type:complete len:231 (-),score=27.24 gnl/TRDRNA2_/TRDRNA2_174223_c0_seq1:352-1044(-)
MTRRALVLGATGLVGRHCLRLLLGCKAYDEVRVLTRREVEVEHPRLREKVIDPEQLEQEGDFFKVDDVFCCLGTTMKEAGSREAFEHVDHELVVRCGHMAKQAGVQRFMVVSTVNANARSSFFYARVKGRMEQDLEALGLPLLALIQPSLLRGYRREKRLAEDVGNLISRLLEPVTRWTDAHWLPVPAERVAQAMVGMALMGPDTGVYRVRYRDFQVFAGKFQGQFPALA